MLSADGRKFDFTDAELNGKAVNAVLILVGAQSQIADHSNLVSLVQILQDHLGKAAPCAASIEIGDILAVRVLYARITGLSEGCAGDIVDL